MVKTILHLCADTGSDSWPYKEAGYKVILVGSKIGVENYYPPQNVYGIIANPPCTEFSIARTGGKPRLGEDDGFEGIAGEPLDALHDCWKQAKLDELGRGE